MFTQANKHPSTFCFTRPYDEWTGLCIKHCTNRLQPARSPESLVIYSMLSDMISVGCRIRNPIRKQWRSWKDQQGLGRRDLGNEIGYRMLPINKPIGHDLTRHSLVRLNPIRTGYGRFKSNMNQMGLSPSASCEPSSKQTAQHISSECPLHSCNGDLVVLDTVARNWLHDVQCGV